MINTCKAVRIHIVFSKCELLFYCFSLKEALRNYYKLMSLSERLYFGGISRDGRGVKRTPLV